MCLGIYVVGLYGFRATIQVIYIMEFQGGRIGSYLLGRTIGKGTFGKVKEAVHIITQEKVAIKILNKSKIEDEQDKERLLREMQILRKIRHPNIIQLYEIMQSDSDIYFVLQYAQKGELFRIITREQRLKEHSAGRLFLQLMNAVEYLHRLNITHRDLKPQNILLDSDYNVKLIDFGLSNYYSKGEMLETACGSPCYAPPEMVSGRNYDGFVSDVWSMGIIFYVMVCGCLPFQDKTTKELYQRIIAGKYAMPEYVSPEAREAIEAMLVTNPDKRITIQQLRRLTFFEKIKHLEPQIYGLMVGMHPMPIDLELLQEMKKFVKNLDVKQAQTDIRQNRHNTITATYYLLQNQILREGGKTNVDLQIYLQSNPEYTKDYGVATLQPEVVTARERQSEQSTKYENANKSLLKKKKPARKATAPVESPSKISSNVPPAFITPTKKFKFGEYTYMNKDYSRRLYRSLSKEDQRKVHSLTKAEQQFRERSKKKRKLVLNLTKGNSEKKLKKPQTERFFSKNKQDQNIINTQHTDSDKDKQSREIRKTSPNKDVISKMGDLPLATKVWNAYFKNNLKFKTIGPTKNTRLNLKQRQKQEIFKQNLKQLKEGFTRLPELSQTDTKKQTKEKSNSKLNTARV